MDPLQLLSDLEGLRDKIPAGWLRDDFEGLITSIRNIYEASVKVITPSKPVSDAKQNLAAHHATLSDLCTQLENSLSSFQDVYTGAGSDSYHTTASASLLSLQDVRDHFATASQIHDTMATNFDTANEAQIALVALLAGLAVTLGVLIFSLGTTAPVTVPAAVAEAAGGAVSIGLLTDAEAAAAAAALSLVWASLPTALLGGLATTVATDLLGNLVLHPPTFTGWNPPTTISLPCIYYAGNSNRKDTANQQEKVEFEYAWKEIQRRLHKKLSKADRRRLHDEITKQGLTPEEIIEIGVSMFGDP